MKPLKFINLDLSESRGLSVLFLRIGVILAFLFLGASALFGHVHIEIEVPHGTWEKIKDEENYESAERVWSDPDGASKRDRERAAEWLYEHEA